MPIKHIKGKTGLVGRKKIRARGRKHYIFAYLWADKESLVRGGGDGDESTLGLHCPNSYSYKAKNIDTWEGVSYDCPPLLSEVHFLQDNWTAEIVAHELCHALLHRLRAVGPPAELILSQSYMPSEEAVCYEFGEWFEQLYSWLWEVSPYGRHREKS